MKRVFSSLLLIFVLPFKQFKKIFKDNFLSGLILGAIFSLVVNIISMQAQGKVEKQRILEAIENEVASNMIQASNVIKGNLKEIKDNKGVNFFHNYQKYSRDLWEQSSEPIQYVAQLKPLIQSEISVYYTIVIPMNNEMQVKLNQLADIQYMNCASDFDNLKLSKEIHKQCDDNYYNLLRMEATGGAKYIFDTSNELLNKFHPTQDRLNSPVLRFLMGSESMRIFSGK